MLKKGDILYKIVLENQTLHILEVEDVLKIYPDTSYDICVINRITGEYDWHRIGISANLNKFCYGYNLLFTTNEELAIKYCEEHFNTTNDF